MTLNAFSTDGMDLSSPDHVDRRSLPEDLHAFWRQLRTHRRMLLAVLICLAIAAATEPAAVIVIKDALERSERSMSLREYVWPPLMILALFLIRGGAAICAAHVMGGVCADVICALQATLYRAVLALPAATALKMSIGRLVHLLTFEVKQCADLVERVTMKLIRHVLTLGGLYLSLSLMNWKLTVVASLAVSAVTLVCRSVIGRLRGLALRHIAANEKLAGLLIERCHKRTVVKMHGTAQFEIDRFRKVTHDLRTCSLSLYTMMALAAPLTQVLAVFLFALISIFLLTDSDHFGMTQGAAIAYVTNLLLVLTPLKNLAELNGPVLRSIIGIQALFAIGNPYTKVKASNAPIRCMHGDVVFQDVHVVYPRSDFALRNVNFKVAAGETVAIMGSSGAGKTTILEMLRSKVVPVMGAIMIDGIKLGDWTEAERQRQIAVVAQHTEILNRSILENVAYGEALPDLGRVRKVLKEVCLDSMVDELPSGLHTRLGGAGVSLSGGQIRLLMLARAIYSNAPIILMDEPTASLDSATERHIHRLLSRMHGLRTMVIVTHSEVLAAAADRVMWLINGEIKA